MRHEHWNWRTPSRSCCRPICKRISHKPESRVLKLHKPHHRGLSPWIGCLLTSTESPHYCSRHGRAQSSHAAGWAMFQATQNSVPRRQAPRGRWGRASLLVNKHASTGTSPVVSESKCATSKSASEPLRLETQKRGQAPLVVHLVRLAGHRSSPFDGYRR